jgi:hypothetical protein
VYGTISGKYAAFYDRVLDDVIFERDYEVFMRPEPP